MRKLGLIAAGGDLPLSLAKYCREIGRPLFVVRLVGFASPRLQAFDGVDLGVAQLGAGIRALREANCISVCFAGSIERPNLTNLMPDPRGLAALAGAMSAGRVGDDALLTFLLHEFESEGFLVEGAHEVRGNLLLPAGVLGLHAPTSQHEYDIDRALAAARAVGRLDAGQAAVSCAGLVLALEAQEGTDAMLTRVAGLPLAIRGSASARRGVLAKVCKPAQDRRIDMPTIGPQTVRLASAAGLAGIVGEPGQLLIVKREDVIALADSLGLFIVAASAEL